MVIQSNKREIKLSPIELVNLLSKNTYKKGSIPLENRLSRLDKVYNICEGRNKAYSMAQSIFFDNVDGNFYGSFKEIADLNNNPNACLYNLSNISLQEYKERCIKVKKNARAEYMFSFVPSSMDSNVIYSLNYVRLFSLDNIENLNPDYIKKRREEVEQDNNPFNLEEENCFNLIRKTLTRNGYKLSNDLMDDEKIELIKIYTQLQLKNNPPRERKDLVDSNEVKEFRNILLETMFCDFCNLDNVKVRDENFYSSRKKLLQNIDGKNIYYAIIDVDKIKKEFIKELDKEFTYKKKMKKTKEFSL